MNVAMDDLVRLRYGLALAPKFTEEALLAGMTEAVLLLQREVQDSFPGVSGLTRASFTADAFSTPAGVLGVMGSASIAAAAVDLGSKPHRPPVEPIQAWVREKLGIADPEARGVAFAIASKIAKSGTKAQNHVANAWARQAGAIAGIFQGVAQDVAAHLAEQSGGAA